MCGHQELRDGQWVDADDVRLGSAPMLGRTRRGRGAWLVAAAVLVAGTAAAVWALSRGKAGDEAGSPVEVSGDPEAERVLEAAQAAMTRASSFRFRFQGVDTTMAYWDGVERRFTGEGAWTNDRWRLVTRDQHDASETILDGDTMYARWPDPGEGLAQEPWEHWESWEYDPLPQDDVLAEMSAMLAEAEAEDGELDDGFVDQLAVALAAGLYLNGTVDRVDWADLEVEISDFPDDPTSFLGVIERGGTTRLLGQANGLTTLAITVRASEDVAAAFGRPIPDGELEVDVGADGLPVALRLRVAGTSDSFDLEVHFSDWGSPLDIEIPTARARAPVKA
jgi:hypothetical protein